MSSVTDQDTAKPVMMSPLLSICIPTYNRAELLESALASLAPQVEEHRQEVELIVSDNCSTDNSGDVVERLARQFPIRYHRNADNVGALRNIMSLVKEHASGEFCWVMGDDEMVRPGAVRKLLQAIKEHPDLDYFYVNYSIDSFQRRERILVTADAFREWTKTGNPNLEERRIARWETLIAEDLNGLTPIYCSVFRRSLWLKGATGLRVSDSYVADALFTSVAETYPQSLIFAQTMVGKPAWSSGYPWLIVCGKESWVDFIPVVMLFRFHDLLDAFKRNGVDDRLLDQHRRNMLSRAEPYLIEVFRGRPAPGLESFSVTKFLARHYRYFEAWRAVYSALLIVPLEVQFAASPANAALAAIARAVFRCLKLGRKVRARVRRSSSFASCV
jgi:hypothetical protein